MPNLGHAARITWLRWRQSCEGIIPFVIITRQALHGGTGNTGLFLRWRYPPSPRALYPPGASIPGSSFTLHGFTDLQLLVLQPRSLLRLQAQAQVPAGPLDSARLKQSSSCSCAQPNAIPTSVKSVMTIQFPSWGPLGHPRPSLVLVAFLCSEPSRGQRRKG